MRSCWLMTLALLAAGPVRGDSPELIRELQSALKQGPAAPAARAAWNRLVAQGPASLPTLLAAMDSSDTVTANWLRTAFDRIADQARQADGRGVDVAALQAFVNDPRRQGRARRLALDLVEQLRPGTRAKLTPGWLDDPEFRYEAVAELIARAEALADAGKKAEALAAYQQAFAATRDVGQAQTLKLRLQDLGHPVRIAEHLGFLTDWYLIGPFDGRNMKSYQTEYPPEKQVELTAELPGKDGPVKWVRYQVQEATSGLPARVALVKVPEALGNADDAVAFAYTAFRVDQGGEVEFRGSADDHFTVWVNGKRAFGFEEYRNGVRLDRHRFKVPLRPGINEVLVKVAQAPYDTSNPQPNWEFLLRVCDATGKGIALTTALPPTKSPK